jgi:hypothetical protein
MAGVTELAKTRVGGMRPSRLEGGKESDMQKKFYVIRLLSARVPTQHDGRYLYAYDPARERLETTDDPGLALQFADSAAAMEKWRENYGRMVGPTGR